MRRGFEKAERMTDRESEGTGQEVGIEVRRGSV